MIVAVYTLAAALSFSCFLPQDRPPGAAAKKAAPQAVQLEPAGPAAQAGPRPQPGQEEAGQEPRAGRAESGPPPAGDAAEQKSREIFMKAWFAETHDREFKTALDLYREAKDARPAGPFAAESLARMVRLEAGLGRREEAARLLDELESAFPDRPELARQARFFLERPPRPQEGNAPPAAGIEMRRRPPREGQRRIRPGKDEGKRGIAPRPLPGKDFPRGRTGKRNKKKGSDLEELERLEKEVERLKRKIEARLGREAGANPPPEQARPPRKEAPPPPPEAGK